MKTLKNVSLLNDYRTDGDCVLKGEELVYNESSDKPWWLKNRRGVLVKSFTETEIVDCKTNLFKFTKEPEEFKFKSFSDVAEKNYGVYLKNEINRLVDYCDVHNNITETFSIAYDGEKDEFFGFPLYNNKHWTIQGLRFNSSGSVKLFIEIFNKNHTYWRDNLINLLEQKRL